MVLKSRLDLAIVLRSILSILEIQSLAEYGLEIEVYFLEKASY